MVNPDSEIILKNAWLLILKIVKVIKTKGSQGIITDSRNQRRHYGLVDEALLWSTRTQVHSPEPLLKARQEPGRLWCQCRGQRDSRSFSSLAKQPSLLWEFQARDRPCLKIQGDSVPKKTTLKVIFWPICKHTYMHMNTCMHACAHKCTCMHAHTYTCRNACMHTSTPHIEICTWIYTNRIFFVERYRHYY